MFGTHHHSQGDLDEKQMATSLHSLLAEVCCSCCQHTPCSTQSPALSCPDSLAWYRSIESSGSRKEELHWCFLKFKGATGRFAQLQKFRLNLLSLSFVICINLYHPLPSLLLYGVLLSLWCFSILANTSLQVSFNLKVILYKAKTTKNTELL